MPTKYELQAARRLAIRQARYETAIQGVLREALRKIEADLKVIYNKYAVDGVLTKAQMTQYNRLATLKRQLIADLNPALRANVVTLTRLRPEQYQAAFFNYAWTIDQQAGIALSWGTVNKRAITETLGNRFFSKAVRDYGPNARRWVREAVNDGLIRGKSYQRMARDLKGAINSTYNQALTIVRTEGGYAQSAGQSDAYVAAQEQGVQGVRRWIATLDNVTRGDHAAMDAAPQQEDGLYHLPGGETARYPRDMSLSAGNRINCRCDETFEIDGYAPELRRTREDGIVPNQTYAEWVMDRRTF